MTRRLVLKKETLTRLSEEDLSGIGGGATTTCDFTIGGSCGIVCITTPVQCFSDRPPCATR